jgi:hypothetical protein
MKFQSIINFADVIYYYQHIYMTNKDMLKKERNNNKISFFIYMFLVVSFCYFVTKLIWIAIIGIPIVYIIYYLLPSDIFWLKQRILKRIKVNLNKSNLNKDYPIQLTYRLNNNGVLVKSDKSFSYYKWKAIDNIEIDDNYIFIMVGIDVPPKKCTMKDASFPWLKHYFTTNQGGLCEAAFFGVPDIIGS